MNWLIPTRSSILIATTFLTVALVVLATFALARHKFRGQKVTLLIRPEHIKLSRNPIDGRKNVRMIVETIVNYGDNALVIGRAGDIPMRVRVLGADVVIIKEGEECCISWTPDAVFVITK